MTSLSDTQRDQGGSGPHGGGRTRGWPLVLGMVVLLTLAGWFYLAAMVAGMVPAMDMSEAGLGMGVFNAFNHFAGLPRDARAALAVLCLPAGATFGMPAPELGLTDLALIFLMWAMMALAMMLPTAVPMLRAYHRALVSRQGEAPLPVLLAMAGYLAVWLAYAAVATAAQGLLMHAGALSDMMAPVSMALTTTVLLGAGIYQFTAAKRACLARCWYPRFAFAGGVPTAFAGFREGLEQGRICLGCCWAVMTVMFAVGLMNVVWIALLGAVMALEKTFPSRLLPYGIGGLLLAWGGFLATLILSA